MHRWFRFSAGFSADWAENVIRAQAPLGDGGVLDPFAGSGTTLLAAQAAGTWSVGVEAQPFIARLTRAKLQWVAAAREFEEAARSIVAAATASKLGVVYESEPDLLQKCYTPQSLSDLRRLQRSLAEHSAQGATGELLWLAFVAIARPVSHVGTAQWQYVLPNKTKANPRGAIEAFGTQVAMMTRDMLLRQASTDGRWPKATLIESDSRTVEGIPEQSIDLVVTSPPYANNYDYADATRLEMTLLGDVATWGDLKPLRAGLVHSCSQQMAGYDIAGALESEALAPIRRELIAVVHELDRVRQGKGGRKAYHAMIAGYFLDMAHVWVTLRKAVREGGRVCFVVGDSAPYGVYVPVDEWLGELAVRAGFERFSFEKVRDRNTKWRNRKHRVPLHEGHLWVQA